VIEQHRREDVLPTAKRPLPTPYTSSMSARTTPSSNWPLRFQSISVSSPSACSLKRYGPFARNATLSSDSGSAP
jgi:hypothetical protein